LKIKEYESEKLKKSLVMIEEENSRVVSSRLDGEKENGREAIYSEDKDNR